MAVTAFKNHSLCLLGILSRNIKKIPSVRQPAHGFLSVHIFVIKIRIPAELPSLKFVKEVDKFCVCVCNETQLYFTLNSLLDLFS